MASDSHDASEVETSLEISDYKTQFVPQDDDDDNLWDVLEILQERRNQYKVRWDGEDPATGKPWAPSWVAKEDCTDTLIRDWKLKQAKKKKTELKKQPGKTRSSTASSKASKRSTVTPLVANPKQGRSTGSRSIPSTSTGAASTSKAPTKRSSKTRSAHVELAPPLPTPKRRKGSQPSLDSENDAEPPPPRKKRKVTVEIVVPEVTKIGPPRGIKRDDKGTHSNQPAEDDGEVDDLFRNELADRSGYWEFSELASDAPDPLESREVDDPDMQTPQLIKSDDEPTEDDQRLSPEIPFPDENLRPTVAPLLPLQPLKAGGSGSIVSRMRTKKQSGGSGSKSSKRTPPLAGSSSSARHRDTHPTKPQNSEHESSDSEPVQAKKKKTIRPLPRVSPSVFRPYLPELDPLPSSIEQFSSPEKDSRKASAIIVHREKQRLQGKGKGQASASNMDDERLRARGLQLAELAASRRHVERRPLLYGRSSSPGHEVQETVQAISQSQTIPESSLMDPIISTSQVAPDDPEFLQQMADAYVDFDAGQGESAGLYAASPEPEQAVEPESSIPLSLGPDIPGKRRRTDLFDISPRLLPKHPAQKSIGANDPAPVIEEFPPTSSTQRAVVDSQSQENFLLDAQVKDLTAVLNEKNATIADLESQLSKRAAHNTLISQETKIKELKTRIADLQAEATALQADNARLAAVAEDMRRKKDDAENDKQLFRDLYSKASTHASEVGKKNDELEEQLRVSTGQVRDGLGMVKSMHEERTRRMQNELDKWKALSKVLTDKDERTNDEVRRRAALEPQLREENERLKLEMDDLKFQFEELQAVMQQYAQSQLDVSLDEQDADADDSLALHSPHSSVNSAAATGFPIERSLLDENDGVRDSFARVSLPATHVEHAARLWSRDSADGVHHVCQYVDGENMCNATFTSDEEVREHAYNEHYPRLQELTNP